MSALTRVASLLAPPAPCAQEQKRECEKIKASIEEGRQTHEEYQRVEAFLLSHARELHTQAEISQDLLDKLKADSGAVSASLNQITGSGALQKLAQLKADMEAMQSVHTALKARSSQERFKAMQAEKKACLELHDQVLRVKAQIEAREAALQKKEEILRQHETTSAHLSTHVSQIKTAQAASFDGSRLA